MKVFKFGGASVKDAAAIENVGKIIADYNNEHLIVVVSAMGKTTNALEGVMESFASNNTENTAQLINEIYQFHIQIAQDLFQANDTLIKAEIDRVFTDLKARCLAKMEGDFDIHYDQTISLGEVLSTKIIAAYLQKNAFNCTWVDARTLIRTNDRWREAAVNWDITQDLIQAKTESLFNQQPAIAITQGFLGHTKDGRTTTLGREGSDFTASIFAYCLNATDVTIWKDVPGMLNADPKYFENTVLLEKISFREAIELAYFGASVIHPKTIQPLKRKKIPLYIRSFIHPKEQGSVIQESLAFDDQIPSFIFKLDQILISLIPRDFSFIIEENLERIFGYLNQKKIRVNMMQNSAVSFSFVVDRSKINLDELVDFFQTDYLVKYNENLELVTIRHFDNATVNRVTTGKKIILEQRTRQTARLVIKDVS